MSDGLKELVLFLLLMFSGSNIILLVTIGIHVYKDDFKINKKGYAEPK